MEVESVITVSPCNGTLILEPGCLIRLALDAQIHDVIAANSAVVDLNVPGPKCDGTPFLDLETLLNCLICGLLDLHSCAVVAFARFHAHLLLAGCESGQICVWDNRLTSRKLPINRSPLTTQAHTYTVSCLAVVGTKNAHNFVSLSRDGRICSWNVDNLTQPVDGKELMTKEGKAASATRMSFPIGEMQTFVVGTDTGEILAASRNGADPAVIKTDVCYKGHSGTLTGIEFHRASGVVDFSHLFISSSHDWTVKLWSTKDANLKFSFESHPDLVLDVAWSPVHPAVFASIDADGNIFVWNLNEDVEGPVARLRAGAEGESVYMNRLIWSPDGKHVFVGDDEGRVHMYDVRESLYVLKSEEWNRFARVLSDMKQSNEEAENYNM